jgi:dienelactone hydrolase
MEIPPPRGPYAVGRSTIVLVDSSRLDPWVASERRVVSIVTWYPAERGSNAPRATYLPNAGALPGPFVRGERWAVSRMSAHAGVQAPIAGGQDKYPVLFFSPGDDAAPEYYSGILEDLASHGYVVLALDPAHEGKGQILDDGRRLDVESHKQRPTELRAWIEFYKRRVKLRAVDASFVLTQLPRLAEAQPLVRHMDFMRAGALGHSIGGVAAAEMCRHDVRIKACENMDGLLDGMPIVADTAGGYAIGQPFLYLGKPLKIQDPALKDSMRAQLRAAIGSGGSGGAYDVIVDGVQHVTFSDVPFLTPTFHPIRKRADLEIVRDMTLAFFDKTLLGKASLLDAGVSPWGERVSITRVTSAR